MISPIAYECEIISSVASANIIYREAYDAGVSSAAETPLPLGDDEHTAACAMRAIRNAEEAAWRADIISDREADD